jgi:hypothetical protein
MDVVFILEGFLTRVGNPMVPSSEGVDGKNGHRGCSPSVWVSTRLHMHFLICFSHEDEQKNP